ncbi:MAG: nucleotidyltransferase domain-containing protein [Rhodocyclaceae bacterium]|nr:nucleotidyltransferase domain-containing protein [Rhodocyclaceae bacterium]MDP1956578.1 nucleotidyltransferase domain-containing protein [Rhodocyclaceae bacterium]
MPHPLPPVVDDEIVAILRVGLPGLQAVYRYGSAGGIYERVDSDVDVAVLADAPLEFATQCRLAAELARLLGRDVDLNDMRRLPVTLRVQIVTGGRRLFAANFAAAEEYDSRVLSDYAYLNESRKAILDDVRARGSIYG